MERRSLQHLKQDQNKLVGYAASFNTPTEIRDATGRSFVEIIRPGAFTNSLKDQPDVRMLRDHNPSIVLGRTKSGTLRVFEDEYGLGFECELPNNSDAEALKESIRRGDVDGASFGFNVVEDSWVKGEKPTRELRHVNLFEISVVAFPAYGVGTSVDLRSVKIPTVKAIYKARLRLAGAK